MDSPTVPECVQRHRLRECANVVESAKEFVFSRKEKRAVLALILAGVGPTPPLPRSPHRASSSALHRCGCHPRALRHRASACLRMWAERPQVTTHTHTSLELKIPSNHLVLTARSHGGVVRRVATSCAMTVLILLCIYFDTAHSPHSFAVALSSWERAYMYEITLRDKMNILIPNS